MKILVKETGAVEEILMIDPKSGIDWSCDYIGNAISTEDFDEPTDDQDCDMAMDQDTYEWWCEQCAAYQAADELHELLRNKVREGDYEDFNTKYHRHMLGVEFNDQPAATAFFCENWEYR